MASAPKEREETSRKKLRIEGQDKNIFFNFGLDPRLILLCFKQAVSLIRSGRVFFGVFMSLRGATIHHDVLRFRGAEI